jgi:hypothetical protein
VFGEVTSSVSSQKSLQLFCPAGTRALSGGASLSGAANGGQVLVESVPVGSPPTAWSIVARDMDGGGTVWGLQARLWCADPPPGFEVVESTSPSNSFSKSDVTSCPSGTVLVGGGGRITSSTVTTAALSGIRPSSTQIWKTAGSEVSADPNDWALETVGLCAAVDPPLVVRNNQVHLSYTGTAQQYCPENHLAIAGGAETWIANGALSASVPWGIPPTSLWIARAGSPDAGPGIWNLDASVLCFSTRLFEDGFECGSTGAWSGSVP